MNAPKQVTRFDIIDKDGKVVQENIPISVGSDHVYTTVTASEESGVINLSDALSNLLEKDVALEDKINNIATISIDQIDNLFK